LTAARTPAPESRTDAVLIDPRGPRFCAAISSVLLAAVVLLGARPAGFAVLAVSVTLFAIGSARGAQGTPQGMAYRRWVQPRLERPAHLEDARPPRFAQTVGLVVTGTGLVLGLLGVAPAVAIAAGIALVAAFLNAALGFCLGCEIYLLLRRLRTS
jgi:hypothetical protein